MGKDNKSKMMSLLNTSGFPFQIAVSTYIEGTRGNHGWRVLSSEHPWENISTNKSGYVDIMCINHYDTQIMIMECKRVKDAQWIFLPTSDNPRRRYAKCWISILEGGKEKLGWYDVTLDPESPEANFCIIRGQDKDTKPMLERIASDLVEATESIALEEIKLIRLNKIPHFRRSYFSVIVTTAKLLFCKFNHGTDIKIENGEVLDAEFYEVPMIRFTKSLTTRVSENVIPKNIKHASEQRVRTLFVINASHLIDILRGWEISPGPWSTW